jgi:hypothetical protein
MYRDRDSRNPGGVPCPIHGDPRFCFPENQEALKIYHFLSHNHLERQFRQGDKTVGKWVLDIKLAISLCQIFGVEDIPTTLETLEAIHKEYYP